MAQQFVDYKRATKGLTVKGEEWLQDTLGRFEKWLQVPFDTVTSQHLAEFLSQYDDKPWRKRSFYLALRTFWKWVSQTRDVPNPMLDRRGNLVVEPPKVPSKILYTITPEAVHKLIEAASTVRNKAIVSLLADSGARRGEIVKIRVNNVDLDRQLIKVEGKGRKEGYLIFGATTKAFLSAYIEESQPSDNLFGLRAAGVRMVLEHLEAKTGIKCNAHSFRRGFATELRRQGVSEMDIMELGRWSSIDLVKRYTKAYTFEDAATRYKPIVR